MDAWLISDYVGSRSGTWREFVIVLYIAYKIGSNAVVRGLIFDAGRQPTKPCLSHGFPATNNHPLSSHTTNSSNPSLSLLALSITYFLFLIDRDLAFVVRNIECVSLASLKWSSSLTFSDSSPHSTVPPTTHTLSISPHLNIRVTLFFSNYTNNHLYFDFSSTSGFIDWYSLSFVTRRWDTLRGEPKVRLGCCYSLISSKVRTYLIQHYRIIIQIARRSNALYLSFTNLKVVNENIAAFPLEEE
jgi:hypothetical protein